jgi:PBP1b-binding outer membrane lipoprotein LpoB
MNERKKMLRTKKYVLITTLIIFVITACGSNTDTESAIQTAVAETVAAQNASQQSVTETPAAT